MLFVITRELSSTIGACELTHVERRPIDIERAREQHAAYRELLSELGCAVLNLPESPETPDAVFVEDTAIVFPELAVIARPGAASRRGETATIASILARFRDVVHHIEPLARLDGGDVLQIGRQVWVGLSSRTDEAALEQLQRLLTPLGYRLHGVRTTGCLHLKSAATAIGDDAVLLNPEWIDPGSFDGLSRIEVEPTEPTAGNVVLVGEVVILSAAFPKTRERLVARDLETRVIDASELAKAEGALTCCSLLFEA